MCYFIKDVKYDMIISKVLITSFLIFFLQNNESPNPRRKDIYVSQHFCDNAFLILSTNYNIA